MLIGLLAACGGPLDRVDGRLVITLAGLPVDADVIDLELLAGGRTFETSVPVMQTIDVFSAVPAGEGALTLTVRDGSRVLTRRIRIPVTIEADATTNHFVDFLAGPEIEIDIPAEVRVYEGRRFDVEVVDRSFETSLDLVVRVDSTAWLQFVRKERGIAGLLATRKLRLKGSPKLLLAFGRCFP